MTALRERIRIALRRRDERIAYRARWRAAEAAIRARTG